MAELRRDRPADCRCILGAQGSGKTWYVQREIQRHRGRVLVWDWKDDHYTLTAVRLADIARRGLVERALRYRPDVMKPVAAQFDLFCRIAWEIQRADPRTDCLFVVEELSEVTQPSYAPPAWKRINVQGRVLGFTVIGTSQRPAYVDKSFTGNATFVRCGRLGFADDAREVGQRIGVPYGDIQRLPDRWAYEFDGRKTTLFKPRGGANNVRR